MEKDSWWKGIKYSIKDLIKTELKVRSPPERVSAAMMLPVLMISFYIAYSHANQPRITQKELDYLDL